MALRIVRKAKVEKPVQSIAERMPWEEDQCELELELPQEQPRHEEPTRHTNILEALKHFAKDKSETLMMIRESTGESLLVLNHDPHSKTTLEDSTGYVFKVKVTERESKLYKPLWR